MITKPKTESGHETDCENAGENDLDILYQPSRLYALLERHGFRFAKSLGQNFLIAEPVARKTAETMDKTCGVLEIGPGAGALTIQLAQTAGKVVAAEIDTRVLPVLAETVGEYPQVSVRNIDAMKLDFSALAEECFAGLTPCLCANLPYNITTPVLTRVAESGVFERVTVMVQKEAGQRLLSHPGEERWGVLPALLDARYDRRALMEVGRGCFEPPPHVDSMVVTFTKKAHPDVPDALMERYERVVTAVFAKRRKTLSNALSGIGITADALGSLGFDPRIRGETLEAGALGRIAGLI